MKNLILFSALLLSLSACKKYTQDTPIAAGTNPADLNIHYSKKDKLENLVNKYVKLGFPGITVAVYTRDEGYWATAAGYAKVESKTPMKLNHLQYLQSATKMYLASAILKLKEEGKIDLDQPITKYLPEKYHKYIDQAASMTVRNLLHHNSGMPDYLDNPAYVTRVLQHPDYLFSSEELLGFIQGKKRKFTPGGKFSYSNSNFHVLALIADEVSGDHNQFIRQKILAPLALNHTFYRQIMGQPLLVNSYLDRFSQGIVENVSRMQQASITFSKGDDGMIATPIDALNFLRGLMEGHLLSDHSLQEMCAFINDQHGEPVYGLGIYHVTFKGIAGYGHGGAGAGAGCGLYYFPDKKTYVFFGTNIGTLVDGPITDRVGDFKDEVLDAILKD